MGTHSSILAWTVPRTEEPGGLQSMGSQGVRHDLATKQQQHSRSREAMRQRCRQHTFRASLPRDPGKVQRLSGFLAPWKQGRSSSYASEVL